MKVLDDNRKEPINIKVFYSNGKVIIDKRKVICFYNFIWLFSNLVIRKQPQYGAKRLEKYNHSTLV